MIFAKRYKDTMDRLSPPDHLPARVLAGLQRPPRSRRQTWTWTAAAAGTLAVILAVTLLLRPGLSPAAGGLAALAAPEYPGHRSYEASQDAYYDAQRPSPDYMDSLCSFSYDAASRLLGETGQNQLFSPVSLALALSMLAEGAGGDTQAALLAALGAADTASLRQETAKLYRVLYTDNDIGRLLLANSLWLDQDASFRQEALDILAQDYYASVFQGDLASPETAQAISDWIADSTRGKLGGDPAEFRQDGATSLLLYNALYFYDAWMEPFEAAATSQQPFTLADGASITVDMMRAVRSGSFYRGEGFTTASLPFQNHTRMVFVLPDEDVSLEELLASGDRLARCLTADQGEDALFGTVTYGIPKFSYEVRLNLRDGMEALGLGALFTEEADFTGFSADGLFLSSARQGASITLDEKGCEAAAFTEMSLCGSGMPQDACELILDRPFLYALVSDGGAPLFVGTVAHPVS